MFQAKSRGAGVLVSSLFLVVAVSFIDGCGSDDDSSNRQGAACEDSEDCPSWACTCNDGLSVSFSGCVFGRCQDGQTSCNDMCESNGGVATVREKQTVKDSPECEAFCARAASLGCSEEPRCDRHFYCDVDEDECAEGKRAHLRCVAERGTWACSGSGGWTVTSGCPSARCAADAGAD